MNHYNSGYSWTASGTPHDAWDPETVAHWPSVSQYGASTCDDQLQHSQITDSIGAGSQSSQMINSHVQDSRDILPQWQPVNAQKEPVAHDSRLINQQYFNSSSLANSPQEYMPNHSVFSHGHTAATFDLSGQSAMTYDPNYAPWLAQSMSADLQNQTFTYPSPPMYHNAPEYTYNPAGTVNGVHSMIDPVLGAGHQQMHYNENLSRSCTPASEQPSFVLTKRCDTPLDDSSSSEVAYAHLLYKCLETAPGHKMGLRDIYNWIHDNCDRVRLSGSKGWQNSVRHNLSMNQGFEKVPSPCGSTSKKGTMWRLTQEALARGTVLSTTQYRKKMKKVNPRKRTQPAAPLRVSAGAKGGLASKRAQEKRRMAAAVAAVRGPTSAPSSEWTSSPALTHSSFSPQSSMSPTDPLLESPYGSPYMFDASRSSSPHQPYLGHYHETKPAPTSNPIFVDGFDQLSHFNVNEVHEKEYDFSQPDMYDNINVNTSSETSTTATTETEQYDFNLFFGDHRLPATGQYQDSSENVSDE